MTIPKNITREHLLQAIQKMKNETVPLNRDSTKYYIFYENEYYPPKYAISLANFFANGLELPPSEFSGGEESNRFLRSLGFEIIDSESQKPKPHQDNRANLIKEVSSWSKYNKPNMIARKKVDWSLFNWGTTIPIEFHEDFEKANNDRHLNRKEKEAVTLIFGEKEYEAQLVNVDRQIKTDTLQLLYGKDLKELLRTVFHSSYEFIVQEREKNKNKQIVLPDDQAEYIEFYETGEPYNYRMKFISLGSVQESEVVQADLTDLEIADHISRYINSKGFYYEKDEIMNLYLSLKTKPFVILSGISGTGKTMMVKWFAESLGATKNNGRFNLIPVRPDWSDGSDLLGYRDIKGDFITGPLLKILKAAKENPDKPYFVLLDEMNLARVEYYFSDILSVMESRDWVDGEIQTHTVLPKEVMCEELGISNNVYIIGTVNMDETTFPFSKKVLDRANTIEFNRVALGNLSFLEKHGEVDCINIRNTSLSCRFLHLKDAYDENKEMIIRSTNELIKINAILEKMGAHVGYRVRDEICFYMSYAEKEGLFHFNEAFDYQILQKILPRLSGSDHSILTVLQELYTFCTGKKIGEEKLDEIDIDIRNAKFPKSAQKLVYMLRRYKDNGFTSFWLGG